MPKNAFRPALRKLKKTRLPIQITRPARWMVLEYPVMWISSTFLRRSSTRSIHTRITPARRERSAFWAELTATGPAFLASEKR
uniref:Uncharacterized protein n=1 Tax=Arundo donax TaxID=35708 RepID=A0A0A9AGD6_ARUDO